MMSAVLLGEERMWAIRLLLIATICITGRAWAGEQATDKPDRSGVSWKLYTNARFGFSVRYPSDWRLGEPLPDGSGILLTPPVPKSQVGLTGFLNLVEGKSQDGRQTLDEFAAAHRRIIGEHYGKKNIALKWQEDRPVTLGGFPASQLSFSYLDETKIELIELHIFSLGRNEGRGVRMKFPASGRTALMPVLSDMLQTYQPGRDQNAVSPFQQPAGPEPKGPGR
jgi:hypothetical protein